MDKKYVQKLENVIKAMLAPVRDIPFNLVIESLYDQKVIEFDRKNEKHISMLEDLKKVADLASAMINKKGIQSRRVNEVGNRIEPFVIQALQKHKIQAEIPQTSSGIRRTAGYPDIEISWDDEETHYLECKTYNANTVDSSQRSFYLSPSNDPKVTHEAIHFIIGFEIYEERRRAGQGIYKTKGWKLLDAYHLSCDVKHEFNSDNRRLYKEDLILAQSD